MGTECVALDFLVLDTATALQLTGAAWAVFGIAWGFRQVLRFLGAR